MEFRLFNQDDAASVMRLIEGLKKESADISLVEIESAKDLKNWNKDNQVAVVAVDHGEVVAVVKGIIGNGSKSHSAFLTAAVKPGLRSRGIAAKLTDFLNLELVKHGVKIVRAYIYSDNTASIKTVEKQGFILSGRVLMHHFDESNGIYVDDLIYHKLLERN
jgi:ribosomal protein S18 acetylase RimI-like enzyme